MNKYNTYYINDAVIIKVGSLYLSDANLFALESYYRVGPFAYLLDGGFIESIAPNNKRMAEKMLEGMKRGMHFFVDCLDPA